MQLMKIATFGVGALSLMIGTVAVANGPGGGPGGHGGGPMGKFGKVIRQLDLTPEQQALVQEFKAEAEAEREAKKAEREEAKEAFKAQMASGDPSAAVLHGLVDARAASMTDHLHTQVDNLIEFYATLSPDQIVELQEIIEAGPPERDRGQRRGWERGRGNGGQRGN
jgi:Spy/CpxP family protein refolding chaperone